ncbi:LysR family transcriptional regulator [Streptomyces uncialis]|uniref:LysR family transcriptional regulator n=1 Tax=Streptomyces uncialis TaxID=1048205 RepID=UPI00386986EE|nr:LysR family transcriptional regulator [Streptomyces uncialis]
MNLDLRLVRYAVVLAEELHFARAADRLHIAQQTLSAQINSLETRLGTTLFVRDKRHVALTANGELFVRRGRELLAQADDLVADIQRNSAFLRLDVITEGLTTGTLVQELRPRLPDVTLEFVQGQGLSATVAAVTGGQVDLAFGRVHGTGEPLPGTLSHQLVRKAPLGIVLPAGHPLAVRPKVTMEALAAYPILLHTPVEAAEWRDWNEELAATFGLEIGWRLHGHGRQAANTAVLNYQAPSFGPLEASVPDSLVVRPVVAPVPLFPYSVIWRSERATSTLRRALAAIHQIATEHDWLTAPAEDWWLPVRDRS